MAPDIKEKGTKRRVTLYAEYTGKIPTNMGVDHMK